LLEVVNGLGVVTLPLVDEAEVAQCVGFTKAKTDLLENDQ
jgi:hypothetical protein